MSVSDGDIAFAMDLFADLGDVSYRKMFGGLGLYIEGTIFALVSSDGAIYLKATGDFADELKGEGASQFHSMPYWALPDAALEDPEMALSLARRGVSELMTN